MFQARVNQNKCKAFQAKQGLIGLRDFLMLAVTYMFYVTVPAQVAIDNYHQIFSFIRVVHFQYMTGIVNFYAKKRW